MKGMAIELVKSATSDKLKEMDWTRNIEICEIVAHDQGQAKDVIKSIKKRLGNKNGDIQLFAVLLLEMLMNNCGDYIHRQVIDQGLLSILVKIVKKKTDLPVRERIFLLLDATQTSLGGASGKFPQYYTAYYDLVCAQVQFPQRPFSNAQTHPSDGHINNLSVEKSNSTEHERVGEQSISHATSDFSIIEKAKSVMEVLSEVLNAVDTKHPEGATDEFTLDLVEQCSFQKQRVVHLIMTCWDEKVVSQAIQLNEQLQKVLNKYDELLSITSTSPIFSFEHEEEEEEPEILFQRIRKGKACAAPIEDSWENSLELPEAERKQRPLIRPLSLDSLAPKACPSSPSIPPPPSKHLERERFFKEKKIEGSTLASHMRGLSIHSYDGSSSSHSGTTFDFND